LASNHVDYVVTCQTDPNPYIIARAPDGLEARHALGDAPEFLERIDLVSAGKIPVWGLRK
jgi:hypothetical protein